VAKAKPATAEPPPPLILHTTTQFDRDVKRQEGRGKSLAKLHAIIETLRTRRPLDSRQRDYLLGGVWKGWRDSHIEPGWLLIYRKDEVSLEFGRTGTHSDLFE
jgi:mRNA interferase YafQ